MADRRKDDRAMDAERFEKLAAAYGGDLRRWPQAERMAGAMFVPGEAGRAILDQAGGLDLLLDSYRVDVPTTALHATVLRAAGRHIVRRRRQRVWWLGLSLAGSGLAGAVAGLALVSIVTPEVQPDHYVLDANVTAFGDAEADGDMIGEDL